MFIYDLNYKSYQNVAILLIFYATDRSSKNICGLNLSRSFKRHVVTMVTVKSGNSPSF